MAKSKKAIRAEIREELRAAGLLPQPKPRLNRKEFSRKTQEQWRTVPVCASEIIWALGVMVPCDPPVRPITSEQVGALKVMALAVAFAEWMLEHPEGGTVGEIYDQVIKPILEL